MNVCRRTWGMAWLAAALLLCGCAPEEKPASVRPAGGTAQTPAATAKAEAKLGSTGSGWGTLVGRVVYDGPRPSPVPLVINKDAEVCGKHMLVDEKLIVGEDGGVKDVAVWLRTKSGLDAPIHPEAAKVPAKVECDNKNCRFEPHVALVWAGKQTVEFKNTDPVGHNVNVRSLRNGEDNRLIATGGSFEFPTSAAEVAPVPMSCNIHPWMRGYLVIRDTPYMAVTDATGRFELANVPEGTWEFQFWQEAAGYLSVPEADKLGRLVVEIKAGQTTDLGKLPVKPAAFSQ